MSDTPNMDMRHKLLVGQQELLKQLRELVAQNQKLYDDINRVANEMVRQADKIGNAAADEREGLTRTESRRVTYDRKGASGQKEVAIGEAYGASPAKISEVMISRVPPPKEPGKRYCGNCGFPGHRAKNCKQPDKTKKRGKK